VHRSHPMNLRNQYYRVWMCVWTPEDRECALATAFMKILESFKDTINNEAHVQAVADKNSGKVTFGEDGFGVARHKHEKRGILEDEGHALMSIVLEDLLCYECYQKGDVYCAQVEVVSEGREDEPKYCPQHRLNRMHALRPTLLMGNMCVEHPLKEWMIARMSENLRKQILINVCINVCMSAAGLLSNQISAMHELRNLRRKAKGLPPLKPGEWEEDDEIMSKSDYEHYKERYLISCHEAKAMMMSEGSQAIKGDRKPVGVGEALPAPKPPGMRTKAEVAALEQQKALKLEQKPPPTDVSDPSPKPDGAAASGVVV